MLRVDQYLRDARARGVSECVAVSVLMLQVLTELRDVLGDDGITKAVTRARHDLHMLPTDRIMRVVDG